MNFSVIAFGWYYDKLFENYSHVPDSEFSVFKMSDSVRCLFENEFTYIQSIYTKVWRVQWQGKDMVVKLYLFYEKSDFDHNVRIQPELASLGLGLPIIRTWEFENPDEYLIMTPYGGPDLDTIDYEQADTLTDEFNQKLNQAGYCQTDDGFNNYVISPGSGNMIDRIRVIDYDTVQRLN